MDIDIKEATTEHLKAVAYDLIRQMDYLSSLLKSISQELQIREELQAEKEAQSKECFGFKCPPNIDEENPKEKTS